MSISRGRIVVSYATNDISAAGVDTSTYDECMLMYEKDRNASCGDYERTKGDLVFGENAPEAVFWVRIMNAPCRQPFIRYVQLTLSVPGGFALIGDSALALLRIDDDDFEGVDC